MANLVRNDDRVRGVPTYLGWDPMRLMDELIRWDPFQGWGGLRATGFTPHVEVHEDDNCYVVSMDLPGVDEKDIDVTLKGNELTISGKREAARDRSQGTFYAYERSYGQFSRAFRLPDTVDGDHVEADLKNGVLTLSLPKRAEAKPRKISLRGILDKVKSLGSGNDAKSDQPT